MGLRDKRCIRSMTFASTGLCPIDSKHVGGLDLRFKPVEGFLHSTFGSMTQGEIVLLNAIFSQLPTQI